MQRGLDWIGFESKVLRGRAHTCYVAHGLDAISERDTNALLHARVKNRFWDKGSALHPFDGDLQSPIPNTNL